MGYFGWHPIVKPLPLQVLSINLLMLARQDQGTILLAFTSCTGSCMIDFSKEGYFHRLMKADKLVDGVESR